MGGIWERIIRSVRKVHNALLKNRSPNDEGLSTLMCEVEAILNSRPLTKVSDDPNNVQALSQITYSFCTLDRSALLESLQRMINLARSVGGRSSTSRMCSGSSGLKSICPRCRNVWSGPKCWSWRPGSSRGWLDTEMFVAIGESIRDLPEQGWRTYARSAS